MPPSSHSTFAQGWLPSTKSKPPCSANTSANASSLWWKRYWADKSSQNLNYRSNGNTMAAFRALLDSRATVFVPTLATIGAHHPAVLTICGAVGREH